jgi:hypothetical protein
VASPTIVARSTADTDVWPRVMIGT